MMHAKKLRSSTCASCGYLSPAFLQQCDLCDEPLPRTAANTPSSCTTPRLQPAVAQKESLVPALCDALHDALRDDLTSLASKLVGVAAHGPPPLPQPTSISSGKRHRQEATPRTAGAAPGGAARRHVANSVSSVSIGSSNEYNDANEELDNRQGPSALSQPTAKPPPPRPLYAVFRFVQDDGVQVERMGPTPYGPAAQQEYVKIEWRLDSEGLGSCLVHMSGVADRKPPTSYSCIKVPVAEWHEVVSATSAKAWEAAVRKLTQHASAERRRINLPHPSAVPSTSSPAPQHARLPC